MQFEFQIEELEHKTKQEWEKHGLQVKKIQNLTSME